VSGRLTPAERAAVGLSAGGLIVNGVRVAVPGVRVTTWLDDPKRAPPITDGRSITAPPRAFVWHTSKGILCRALAPDAIPSTHAETLALYQSRTAREVSWHLTVDTDADVLQQADPARWQCWHAGGANAWSLGAELVQRDATGTLTEPQIRAAADVTDAVCAALAIPRRVLVGPDGAPWVRQVKDLQSTRAGGRGLTWAGVLGHVHLTTDRGPGDPGPWIFAELIARGYARHVVDGEGRIAREPLP
jgi:hypothetical protein